MLIINATCFLIILRSVNVSRRNNRGYAAHSSIGLSTRLLSERFQVRAPLGGPRFLPIMFKTQKSSNIYRFNEGRSSAGPPPDCDSGGRGFNPCRPPHFTSLNQSLMIKTARKMSISPVALYLRLPFDLFIPLVPVLSGPLKRTGQSKSDGISGTGNRMRKKGLEMTL